MTYCAFVVWLAVISGCIPCQEYYARPLTQTAVQQQLDVRETDFEHVQACACQSQLLPQPEGVKFSDGLSPDEAAYVAVLANPGLRTIRDQRGLAQAQVIQAGILPNPQFGFNSDSPSFGATAGTVTADTESLSWDVSKLNSRSAKMRSAFAAAAAVDWEIARQEWLVAQEARQAVFDLVAIRQQIMKLEEAEKLLQANLKLVEKAEKEGNLTLVDLSAATSASATIHTNVLAAIQQERQRQLMLNRVLGLPTDAGVTLQDDITLPIGGSPPDAVELYSLLDERFDLVSMRCAYDSQDQALRAAVAAQVPATTIAVTRARDTGDVGTWGAGVAVDVPLFDRNQGNVALERASRDKMYDQYLQSVFEVRNDVDMAVAKLRVIVEQIDATEKSVASLEKLVETYDEVVKRGAGNVLVYYQAFNDLAQSRVRLIQLQNDFVDAWIALEIAIGERLELPQPQPSEPLPPPDDPNPSRPQAGDNAKTQP